jgi:thiamine-phosphate pyrophosphorylase
MTDLPGLHVVTNDSVLTRPDFVTLAAVLAEPSTALHLRGRNVSGRTLQSLAADLRSQSANLHLIINDRIDVAVSMGTYGVHLPELGLPLEQVRKEFGRNLIIGKSTHSPTAALKAIDAGADYAFLGPIWPTPSHPDRPAIGIDAIREARDARVIAIGGVNAARAPQCLDAGAYGIAVISAVWNHPQPPSVAVELLSILKDYDPSSGS